ncbi:thiamine-phosphate synthase [Neptunitalea chrysea]|uniref:Thiamine-phosphate synthase n=1 Tax=Neptunitalea chrysea TaxID=1647581 RepID=A0A9W6B5Y7_9FLAO|nr:thiamine phosphate synthase [Neptunitalea chrysea]GLB53253.1 thiamine-phosphate synthase [Neptunitalea chrysea]
MKASFNPSLYLVTDSTMVSITELPTIVEKCVLGGVTMVQLREKTASTRAFVSIAFQLKEILAKYHVPLIINDRIDVALAIDADGIHIGQDDMPYHIARRILGPDKIIGLSVESYKQVEEANLLDVDYIGISPVFNTPTKTDTKTTFGIEGVEKIVAMSKHRTVAIGGIHLDNARPIIKAGANGVAVVSALMKATDPKKEAQKFKEIL